MNPSTSSASTSSGKRPRVEDVSPLLRESENESEGSDVDSGDDWGSDEDSSSSEEEYLVEESATSEEEGEPVIQRLATEWSRTGERRDPFPTNAKGKLHVDFGENPSPITIFDYFFDEHLAELISRETNLYATQVIADKTKKGKMSRRSRDKNWEDTNPDEIRFFIGLLILQGIVHKPTIESYFSRKELLKTPFFYESMTESRFSLLLRFLHFNNNLLYRNSVNKELFKIRPVMNYLVRKWRTAYTPERDISIDESLLLWKGRLGWRQYIPTKRARYGMKSFHLCESSTGYICNAFPYLGKRTQYVDEVQGVNVSAYDKPSKIVLKLIDYLLNKGHRVFLDNFYSSPQLFDFLCIFKTDAIGTVRMGRKQMPKEMKKAVLKKGQCVSFYRNKLMALKWMDKKNVCLLSTIHDATMVRAKSRKGEDILKPAAVVDYNKSMGGVDLADQCIMTYNMARKRLKKYYQKIFRHLIDMTIFNSHVLYKKCGGELTALKFRLLLVQQITDKYQFNRPGMPRPIQGSTIVRSQEHFPRDNSPTPTKKRAFRRCKLCATKNMRKETGYSCMTCNVPLCVTPCFAEYHRKGNCS